MTQEERIAELEKQYPCTEFTDGERDCWTENYSAEDACENCKTGFGKMLLVIFGDELHEAAKEFRNNDPR